MNIYANENPWTSFEVKEQIAAYLESCRSRRLSNRTVEAYTFYLNYFAKWSELIDVSDVRNFNPHLLRNYLEWVQKPKEGVNRSANTVHGAFRVLRSFFKFLESEEAIVVNPVNKLKAPRLPKQILPPLSNTEIQKIIEHWSAWETKTKAERNGLDLFDLRNLALFYFLLDTGVRVDECSRVRVHDVDFKSGRVFVRCGKGEKDRITFLSEFSLKYLSKYIRIVSTNETNLLWIGQLGPMSAPGIQMIFKRLSRELKFSISPHRIRRTFAIMMLRNGADLYRLKELMGHSDIRTLESYLSINEEDIKAVHKSHSPVSTLSSMNH